MSNITIRNTRARVLLVALAVLLGASCTDENPASPPAGPAATHLRFTLQPIDAFVDTWSPEMHALLDEENGFAWGTKVPVQVEILDANENRVASATDAITLTLAANPGGARLYSFAGTTTHAVDGVAQFYLTLDQPGSGYALEASTDGLERAISNEFNVTFPPATQLGFLVQPNDARVDTWSQATHEELGFVAATVVTVSIEILDEMGFRVTSATDAVTLALTPRQGGGALHPIFGSTVRAVDGIAVFELTIDQAASGYSLTATADGLTDAVSDGFAVTNDEGPTGVHLAFSRQPNNAKVDPWSIEDHALLDESIGILASTLVHADVEILSAAGQRIRSATDAVTLVLNANPGGASLYSFYDTTLHAVDGIAVFEFTIDELASGYTVAVRADGMAGATSYPFTVFE